METGQPSAALREFETSLKATPNRYRGLWGAARAAEAAGDRRKPQVIRRKSSSSPEMLTHRDLRSRSHGPNSPSGDRSVFEPGLRTCARESHDYVV